MTSNERTLWPCADGACHPVPRKRGGVIGPATSGRTRWRGPPPPLSRGGKQIRSRDAAASESCVTTKRERNNFFRYASRKTGRRSAERRTIHWPHRRRQVCAVCATVCRCGGGSCGSRSPSGAPRQRLPERANAPAQPRPRFTRPRGRGRYPRRRSRLSQAPGAPVVMPEGSMPGPPGSGLQARPQELHSPHPTAVTGRRP
jgi:hypothetical protein